jgi:Xaa-Pro aminopeptidase
MTFPPDRARRQYIPRQLGLAAIVAMSPENFAYASGAFILTVSLVRPRQAFVIIPALGEPVLVVCSIEKALTQSESWIKDIRTYVEFVDHPIDALCATLRSLGIEKGQVGCDLD